MSGKKYSEFQFDAERERRSQSLSRLSNMSREAQGIRQQISAGIREASEGVRQHFGQEVGEAQKWLEGAQETCTRLQSLTIDSAASALSGGVGQLERLLAEGRQVQERLRETLTGQVNRLRRDLSGRLAQQEGVWRAQRELIRRWLGEVQERQLRRALEQASQAVHADAFTLAEQHLKAVENDLKRLAGQASEKEAEQVRQQQARQLLSTRREVESCAFSLRQILQSASEGLRETFTGETQSGQQWLEKEQTAREAMMAIGENAGTEQLRTATERLQALLIEGQKVIDDVQHAYTQIAGELRTKTEKQVATVETLFNGGRELLELWFGGQALEQMQAKLQAVQETLKAERLRKVEVPCQALQEDLRGKLRHAEEQEARHQRRMYLLKALRQVCADLGFGETLPPRYEREGDRGSRIILTVDTYNRGEVTFYLSLESIETDSCISEVYCDEEFDRLSTQLAEQFGVQTKFRRKDGETPPRLIRKGEKEEPGGGEKTQGADR